MKFLIVGALGFGPAVFAQTATGTHASDLAPYLTAGAVLSLAAAVYKILTNQITELKVERDALIAAANRRAEEDRRLLIPLLTRSIETQASYIQRSMGGDAS